MTLTDSISHLVSVQTAIWDTARHNHEALSSVLCRKVDIGGTTVAIQHNPARAISSSACTDPKAIQSRPCFLCEENRPSMQQSVRWNDYDILLNPYPIFPGHLTIAARTHTPQNIIGRISDLISLVCETAGYTIFYNGPRCGASAPDHAHFQGVPSDYIPLWQELDSHTPAYSTPAADIYALAAGTIVLSSHSPEETVNRFTWILSQLHEESTGTEPMVNILCRYKNGIITTAIIPRRRHRPENYTASFTDTGSVMISPGAIDVAGTVIAPRLHDYNNITAAQLRDIFGQVTYRAEEIFNILKGIQ